MLGQLIRFFLQGLLYTVPVAIMVYVVIRIFIFIGDTFRSIGLTIHPFADPFIGLAAFVTLMIIIGVLGSTLIFRPIFGFLEGLIERAPLIKTIYSSAKDVMSAFVGSKKRFNKPVLVKLNRADDIERLGFVTQNDLTEIGITKNKVAVYLPFSYAISGNLYIVPRENITPVNATAAEIMKLIISGGVTDLEDHHHIKK